MYAPVAAACLADERVNSFEAMLNASVFEPRACARIDGASGRLRAYVPGVDWLFEGPPEGMTWHPRLGVCLPWDFRVYFFVICPRCGTSALVLGFWA